MNTYIYILVSLFIKLLIYVRITYLFIFIICTDQIMLPWKFFSFFFIMLEIYIKIIINSNNSSSYLFLAQLNTTHILTHTQKQQQEKYNRPPQFQYNEK